MRIRRFSTDRVRSHHSRRRSPPPHSKWKPRTSRRFPKFPERLSASPPSFPRPSSSPYLSPLCLSASLSQYIPPRVCATLPLPHAPPRFGLMCSSRAGTSGVAARPGVLHPLRLRVNSPLFAGLSPSLPGLSTRSSVLLAPDERFSQTRSAQSGPLLPTLLLLSHFLRLASASFGPRVYLSSFSTRRPSALRGVGRLTALA